jgi:histidyl-tRNA synthetase
MRREGVWPEEKIDVDYFIAIIPGFRQKAIEVAMLLRKKGYRVDLELRNRGIGKQMKYANKINAKYTVIVGEETREGKVVVKDMESGEQEVIPLEKLGN